MYQFVHTEMLQIVKTHVSQLTSLNTRDNHVLTICNSMCTISYKLWIFRCVVRWQAAKIFNLQMRAQGCNNRGGIPGIIER